MKQKKTIQNKQKVELNLKENINNKTNQNLSESVLFETIAENEILKPTSESFKNIHSEPADEQQLERND